MSNKDFRELAKEVFDSYLQFNPQTGAYIGLHEYDGKIGDSSVEAIRKEAIAYKELLDRLKNFPLEGLDSDEVLEHSIAVWGLESQIFGLEEIESYKKNPMHYAFMFSDLHGYISRNYAPFDDRIKSIVELIGKIPTELQKAEETLNASLPSVLCKYAIQFSKGYDDFFKNELLKEITNRSTNEELINEYIDKSSKAVAAFERYVEVIEMRSNENDESYKLGKEKFERMLRIQEHADFDVAKLKTIAEVELNRLRKQLDDVIKSNGFEGRISELEHQHPDESNLLEETGDMLSELVDFIREKKIVSLPDKLNCIVTEMPRYMNFGFAAMGTAGPFEKSDESFYYVNFPDKEWTNEKKEEWMTQFNYPTLTLISIHEAYPGHYAHFLNANIYSTLLSKIFMSYSYIEGWAHYSEEMMIEQGYGKGDFKIQIGMLLEALIRCCRFVVSIGIHCEQMTMEDAKQFFIKNALMADLTAQQEAERAAFDPGYLNYTLGKILLKQLREKYMNHFEGKRSLFDFHNRIVSLGAPTFDIAEKYILEK